MCGIVIAHGIDNPSAERPKLIACSKKIRHRGPDWSGCYSGKQTILAHERLAIVGVGALRNSVIACEVKSSSLPSQTPALSLLLATMARSSSP